MPKYKKVDSEIHAQIREGLRDAGYTVFDVHALPGRLDLDVRALGGVTVSLEVKQAGEKLTPREQAFFDGGWVAEVVHSLAEALLAVQKWDPVQANPPVFHLCSDGLALFYHWCMALESKDRRSANMIKSMYLTHCEGCKNPTPCTKPTVK